MQTTYLIVVLLPAVPSTPIDETPAVVGATLVTEDLSQDIDCWDPDIMLL